MYNINCLNELRQPVTSIYDLKPKFQALLRPIVNFLVKVGITPNQITIFSAIASVGMGLLIACNQNSHTLLLILPLFLFLRMALNAIDGILAKEHNMQTKLGAFLNELGDIVSDTGLYLPFALIHGFQATLVIFIIILSILSETAGILAQTLGGKRRYDGPMGKSDRAFVFGLIALLLGLGVPLGNWLLVLQGVLIILLTWTIINRVVKSLQETA
jgi:CDP-diacylglycerol---glycerol-3-phosphate 3-phosphatidyltransferase